MNKKFWLTGALILVCAVLLSAAVYNGITIGTGETFDCAACGLSKPYPQLSSTPGSCTGTGWMENTTDHSLNHCVSGTWTAVSGGGGGTLYDEIPLSLGGCDWGDGTSTPYRRLAVQWSVVSGTLTSPGTSNALCDAPNQTMISVPANGDYLGHLVNVPSGFVNPSDISVVVPYIATDNSATAQVQILCDNANQVNSATFSPVVGSPSSFTTKTFTNYACTPGHVIQIRITKIGGTGSIQVRETLTFPSPYVRIRNNHT